MRMTGRWSNEAGAHAGFTSRELNDYCSSIFGSATDISDLYYRHLYRRREAVIDTLTKTGLKKIVFPCVYFAGTKSNQHIVRDCGRDVTSAFLHAGEHDGERTK